MNSLDVGFEVATKFMSDVERLPDFCVQLCRPSTHLSDSHYDSHFVLAHLSLSYHGQNGAAREESKDNLNSQYRLHFKPPRLNI